MCMDFTNLKDMSAAFFQTGRKIISIETLESKQLRVWFWEA